LIPLEEIAENLKKNVELIPSKDPVVRTSVIQPPRLPTTSTQRSQRAQSEVPEISFSANSASSALEVKKAGPETGGNGLPGDFVAALISQIETQNPRLAAALESAHINRAESKISFYVPESYFKMMKLDARDQLELQTMLQQKLGAGTEVEIHKGEPPTEKETVKVSTPETLVENDPIVQEFVKRFKGKITKIDFNKERYL